MALPTMPPFNVYEYWELQWTLGPASDGLSEYFGKWYAGWLDDETVETLPFGSSKVRAWRRREFTGQHEFLFIDDGAQRSGIWLRYAAVTDEDGEETLWAILEGLTDLDVAWRFDLIEAFPDEPTYDAVKAAALAYWRGESPPMLLMQIDARTLEFFFVPRDSTS